MSVTALLAVREHEGGGVYMMTSVERRIIEQFISELQLDEAISRAKLTLMESG